MKLKWAKSKAQINWEATHSLSELCLKNMQLKWAKSKAQINWEATHSFCELAQKNVLLQGFVTAAV